MTKPLSPATQAVVDAAITGRGYLQPAIAAALRAAADQLDHSTSEHTLCVIAAELEAP
jgi:hypothetical protein